MRRFLLAASLALAMACAPPAGTLRIATTTSVDNSGLLEFILPALEADTGFDVQVIAVGSGQAFNLGRRGDVALLVTHEPVGERALFDDGLVRHYRKIMFNRFVVAGPAGDPARVAQASSAADAMRRIAASGAVFVSRGDESGTHVRERALWQAAGVRPAGATPIETGQGMAATLRVASERGGYVLTDEATLARLAHAVSVTTLFADDPALINTYAVLMLSTADPATSSPAAAVAAWLAGPSGRSRIDAYRIDGRQVFFPWPPGADARTPESMPGAARQ